MIRSLALAVAIVIATLSHALADVSADLVFCSKQANPRERIACYDAAARIAASATTVRVARRTGPALITTPVADTPAPPAYMPAVEKNPFQGLYAAVGGSYGFSSPRSVGMSSSIFTSFSDSLSAQGFSGHAS